MADETPDARPLDETLRHVDAVLALALRLPTEDARRLLAVLRASGDAERVRLVAAFVYLREELDAVLNEEPAD